MESLFWACVIVVLYAYCIYPLAVFLCARCFPARGSTAVSEVDAVSIVVIGHREGERILDKALELCQQLDCAVIQGEIVVVLDGIDSSPSGVGEYLRSRLTDDRIKVVSLPCNVGKAAAISIGVARAGYDLLVFADARQRWREDALPMLIKKFRDDGVGAVSGELILETQEGVAGGVGLYWRYEKWLRLQESQFDSITGVTGAICAVRRSLFEPVPKGTILDDVYWPLKVVMKGFRVLHVPCAIAYDRLPSHAKGEFRRKVRTLCGNFQLISLLPAAILPWKNRLWWQFISHKLLRLLVPWTLLGMYASSALIDKPFYQLVFITQSAAYGLTPMMMMSGLAKRSRLISAAAAFLMLNCAAWVAFWVWITGREATAWKPVTYDEAVGDRA